LWNLKKFLAIIGGRFWHLCNRLNNALNMKYTSWQDGDMWLGYFRAYPDYMTQGASLD
jgi:hypothetical protein